LIEENSGASESDSSSVDFIDASGNDTTRQNHLFSKARPSLSHHDASSRAFDATPPRYPSRYQPALPIDADLTAVIEAWPGLPETTKAGIMAMIKR